MAAETPVALAGYCAVQLGDEEQWVRGDPRWSVVYAGRTFLLSGPEQQQRFLAAPAATSPPLPATTPSWRSTAMRSVAGKPEYSVFCGGKVYLFSSAETLAQFHQNPRPYMAPAQYADRRGFNGFR